MILSGVLLAVAILVAAFAFFFRSLLTRNKSEVADGEWLETFSVDSYAPMERLLDRGDFAYLAAQPGYRPEIAKRLLKERRRLFLDYLNLLIGDFNRLLATAKLMVVFSTEDRPEFARAIRRQQMIFVFAVAILRCKVAIYPYGWTALDVPKLVREVEVLRDQIYSLSVGQSAPSTN